jgi:hypothetical protein
MKTSATNALVALCLSATVGAPPTNGERGSPGQDARSRFVGSWRLVSLEHRGPDGNVEKADCIGQFVFTADGHAAVQVMYRKATQAESTQYAQGGYEATFGRYTVDVTTRTFIFHVDGALVRTLVGQDLRRKYTFADNQLIVEPSNTAEHWRVVWTRDQG